MQANAAKADGQRAWWKLRGNWRVLSVVRVLREQQRAMCRQIQQKADGQRAWWKLPRGNWRVLSVLRVRSLANGRLECPNKRGLCAKGQAAMLER